MNAVPPEDPDDLIWRLALVALKLREGEGDRRSLLLERADLMRIAKNMGLLTSRD